MKPCATCKFSSSRRIIGMVCTHKDNLSQHPVYGTLVNSCHSIRVLTFGEYVGCDLHEQRPTLLGRIRNWFKELLK